MQDRDNKLSKNIGSVLGPLLIAVTTSEVLNFGIWTENNPPLTYLNGMILFAAGLAIVRFHHRWRPLWTASITLAGWLMMAGGVMRLYLPSMEQASPGPVAYAFIGLLCFLGLVMTFKAYR